MASTEVRPETRNAWNTLIAQGETPSVREVYRLVGGKYTRVAQECKALRLETNGAREELPAKAEPEPKTYVCTRYPEMRIRHIHFCGGVYETSEPEEQQLIEQNDWYLVFIFPC